MRKPGKIKRQVPAKRPAVFARAAAHGPPAFERERLLHNLQVHQVELEAQNRELRDTQRLLEISRDRYADLYDYAPVGYATFSDMGLVREINLTAAAMLGVDRPRLIGLPFGIHVEKVDQPAFREHLRTALHATGPTVTELRLIAKNRPAIQAEIQSVPVPEAGGRQPLLCRSILTDITERKRAEDAVRRSGIMLSRAQEIAHVGGFEIDLSDSGDDHWSPESFRILGLDPTTRELTPGEYVRRCVHPEDRERVREAFVKSRDEGVRFDLEYREDVSHFLRFPLPAARVDSWQCGGQSPLPHCAGGGSQRDPARPGEGHRDQSLHLERPDRGGSEG